MSLLSQATEAHLARYATFAMSPLYVPLKTADISYNQAKKNLAHMLYTVPAGVIVGALNAALSVLVGLVNLIAAPIFALIATCHSGKARQEWLNNAKLAAIVGSLQIAVVPALMASLTASFAPTKAVQLSNQYLGMKFKL